MKRISLVATTLTLALGAGAALAGPTAGNIGLNIGMAGSTTPLGTPTDFMVKGKYAISTDMAILAGAGLQMVDTGAVVNNKFTNIGLMGGIRKYMATNDFAPFFGGRLEYLTTRDVAANQDVTDMVLQAEFGAEYFMAKQFSLEGSVAAGYASQKRDAVGGVASVTATGIGTISYNVSANLYF